MRSCVQESAMMPKRLTRPKVGRKPARPQRAAGVRIDPLVSEPMPNATHPAAVAEQGPADEPDDPTAGSHGLFVWPPNQLSPEASSPVLSLAISTAPDSRSISTTLAS